MIARENLQDLYPLSPMQEGMLFHWLLEPASEAYVEQMCFRLRGALDVPLFEACWGELSRRHDVFRTVFVWEKAARPLQVVLREAALPIRFEDLTHLAAQAQRERLADFRRDDRTRRFDLGGDVPSRVTIFRLASDVHEVVWTFHHIVLDGWSVGLVLADVLALYGARRAGHEPRRDGAAPYSTYVTWLETLDRDALRRYWREYLDGYTGVATIPSSRPGGVQAGYRARRLGLAFDADETAALDTFGRRHGVTLGTLVQTFWGILLSRYNAPAAGDDRHDVTFGFVVSGRSPEVPGVDRMVGLFTNTIPVRVRFHEGDSVAALLERVQAGSVAAQLQGYLPLAEAQTESGMIDHILTLENYPLDGEAASSLAGGWYGFRVEAVEAIEQIPYDLNVAFTPGRCLGVDFHFNESRYSEAQIRRLFGELRATAAGALADAARPVGEVDVLSPAERVELGRFTDVPGDFPADRTIDDVFAARVAEAPDAPAVVGRESVLTYGAASARADRLARALADRFGVRRGDHVGVVLDRSADLPVCFLAILRAGGVYVPVDPAFPAERIAHIVSDSGCRLVITTPDRRGDFAGALGDDAITDVDELLAEPTAPSGRATRSSADPAYVIYTSGSTGTPKGVTIAHRGIVNVMTHHRDFLPVTAGDRVVLFASPSFDASVWEMCVAWLNGAALVVADRETVADPARFGALLRELGATLAVLPPSYVRLLDRDDLAVLSTLVTAGEAAHADTMRQLSGRLRCINAYGPSETSIAATCHLVRPDEPPGPIVPIGRPVSNTETLVLDARGRFAPIGASGELCIAGAGVGHGYLNRPALTAERFVPHPLRAGERMYRTGDVVRWLDDGTLEFLGRNDDQVKIRGYRIELGEIEARLLSHASVRQATVIARAGEDGAIELVGYVVPAGAASLGDLRRHLRTTLPDYMVPGQLVALERLPLTPQGKVDRTALPAPSGREASPSATGPRDALEADLVGIWREVLDGAVADVHASFFDLGGHSLTAVRLVSRIRRKLALPLDLRDFFLRPTIAELAAFLRGRRMSAVEPIPRLPDQPDHAVSRAQHRLWILDQLTGDAPAYNVSGALVLDGELDVDAFERALAALVDRHEALRTTFTHADGALRQRVHPSAVGEMLRRLDFAGEADPDAAALDALGADMAGRFDLAAGPLLRVTLMRLADRRHVLVVVLHHIVCDGWSVDVIVRELSVLYRALRDARGPDLPPLAVHYRDFAAWQNARLSGLGGARDYWHRKLASPLPVLELPTDFPQPLQPSFRGRTVRFTVDETTTAGLAALGRGRGASLFMVLVAVVKTLLHRYSGQRDVIVGHPVAGREHPDLEHMVGFFVNTLPLRDTVDPESSFLDLLDAVRQTALDALAHQGYPFDQLVEELAVARDLTRNPVFDVMVVFEPAGGPTLDLAGVSVLPLAAETTTSKFELLFGFAEAGGRLGAAIEYRSDLFHPETIARLQGHLLTLMADIVARPEAPLFALSIVTAAERAIVAAPDHPERWPEPTITACVDAQAARRPGATAVVCGDQRLTYDELDRRANQLARHLRRYGVGPEVRVGLCLDRSVDMIVGLLGILKAGGAYLPLDPALPPARLAYMLRDARAPVCVTLERFAGAVSEDGGHRIVCLDRDGDAIAREPSDRIDAGGVGEHLAYVMYTSGSTGRPKGVMVEQRNVLAQIAGFEVLAPSRAHLVGTALCSFGFDVSVCEVFTVLSAGGTLHVLPLEVAADPDRLARYLVDHGITSAYIPPGLLDDVITRLEAHGPRVALDRAIVGVEPLTQRTLQRLRDLVPDIRIVNIYGPTEATVCCTVLMFRQAVDPDRRAPIGTAVPGYQVYLLDAYLQPVPIGIPGEVYVGGPGVARGYVGADLTAERFIADPFAESPGARLYRTGDHARYLSDGNIEFLGRRDRQVKIRGFRVEPEEIEVVLGALPTVQEAVVVVRPDVRGDLGAVAYVALRPDAASSGGELRAALREKLPEYMIPGAFVMLASLPRTPNGKVARAALPEPGADHTWGDDAAAAPRAPGTPLQELVAGIWADVLNLERVGIDDSFFDLGGHSLLATRLVGRIRDSLGAGLSLRHLFETPTIRAIAERLDGLRGEASAFVEPVRPVERSAPLPLSFAQQRLWFLAELEPTSSAYNLPVALRLAGPLDARAIEQSLDAIVARHEVLRTNFVAAGGVPVQVIAPVRPLRVPVIDLAAADATTQALDVRRLAAEEGARPFDLAWDALVRARLLRLAPDEHVLLLTMHHIVADGWSVGVLLRELATLYNAIVSPSASGQMPLEPLALQYADFACWQRRWLTDDAMARQLDYWRRQLADLPGPLALPTDRPRPAERAFRAGTAHFELTRALTEELVALSRRSSATPFMTLLAAFKVLLSRYSGQDDVVVGTPIANRTRPEIEPLIGFFANTLVLRTDLGGDPSFSALVARIREVALGAYAHQDVPFEQLVEALRPERSLDHTPLFQVLFVLQNAPVNTVVVPGLTATPLAQPVTTAKFDLTLSMEEREGRLAGAVEYDADLFDAVTIARMIQHLETLLAAVATAPETPISRLPLMTPEERQRVLGAAAAVAAPIAGDGTVLDVVAAQVARAPRAIAVEDRGKTLDYAELDARANRLAHHLRRLGADRNVPVGLCLDRSIDLPVAVLGIVRSGAPCLPLDPSYPSERLRFMIEDASVSVLVTRSGLADDLRPAAVRTVRLDLDGDAIARQPATAPDVEIRGEDLLCVIYTSGSTGRPKGVRLPLGVLANLIGWGLTTASFAAPARTLQFAPISFDVSFQEILTCWASGGTLVMIDEERRRDPRELLDHLRDLSIERLFLPFVALQSLAEAADAVDDRRLPRALAQIVTGGEQLQITPAVARLFERLPGCELHNHYGPTESHVVSTHVLSGNPSAWPRVPPIGRPIVNARLYVLDRHGEPVPIGVPGELSIGGSPIAEGYVNRAELTAERFVPDPFAETPGARMYRTGDLVRLGEDGTLEFLGRQDTQVKIRGFRVELAEVEAALNGHPAVSQAVVGVHEPPGGVKRLIAYVVAAPGARVEGAALRRYLADALPDYMIPAGFVTMDALPLTASGKVSRRALPAPDAADTGSDAGFVAPTTPTEQRLAPLWEEALGVSPVGVHDNFFDLGGHSLLATRLASRIRTAMSLDLPLRRLFEAPTIETLAALIDGGRVDAARATAPLVPVTREEAMPLSFAQERMWFVAQLEGPGATYTMPAALRLSGTLDAPALAAGFREIVRRHEILRTRFVNRDGVPAQIVEPDVTLEVPLLDLQGLAADRQTAEVDRLVMDHARTPFDLTRAPLLRVTLVRLGPTEHVLMVAMHHIVADGWSIGVLARELTALYGAFARGESAPLPPLPLQYADFAHWQRRHFTDAVLAPHRAYWQRQLAGAPALIALPTDRPRPPVQTFQGATVRFRVDAALARQTKDDSRRAGVTLYVSLLSAYAALLYRVSGQGDFVIGAPVANRTRHELEPLIGFFVNEVPIRVELSGNPTFADLRRQVHATALDAFAHEDMPFESIVKDFRPARSLSAQTPLSQVVFVVQNAPTVPLALPGLLATEVPIRGLSAKYDLTLSIEEVEGELVGTLEYATDLFDASTVQQMTAAYLTILRTFAEAPDVRVLEIPLAEGGTAEPTSADDFAFDEPRPAAERVPAGTPPPEERAP